MLGLLCRLEARQRRLALMLFLAGDGAPEALETAGGRGLIDSLAGGLIGFGPGREVDELREVARLQADAVEQRRQSGCEQHETGREVGTLGIDGAEQHRADACHDVAQDAAECVVQRPARRDGQRRQRASQHDYRQRIEARLGAEAGYAL
jgi:hypothetical protein